MLFRSVEPILKCGKFDITKEIRSELVTENVSAISALPEIRQELVKIQREIIANSKTGIVVEGRDIGTVVAPNAQLKVFLTADLDARANRRETEIGTDKDLKQSLANRDEKDSTRKISPLEPALDAYLLDSTAISLEETVENIWEVLRERKLLGLPIVAILGRPNVGKSTLVNRFLGRREAIVEDTPGVTRDRVRYECEWNSRKFVLMDTGGWESKPDGISVAVSAAAEIAISEADILLFVVDAQVGAVDRKSTRLNSSHMSESRMPSSA